MNSMTLIGGATGTIVSAVALYIFVEISIAYWLPERAGKRWESLIHLPKLEYFAPTFRWMMPILAMVTLVRLFSSAQIVIASLGVG
ncbi:MAG: hypothetical protein ACU84Q_11740 [Gammaproteobacteria bacterium]